MEKSRLKKLQFTANDSQLNRLTDVVQLITIYREMKKSISSVLTCQTEVKDAVSSESSPPNKRAVPSGDPSADGETNNWTGCTLNSRPSVGFCLHSFHVHTKHSTHQTYCTPPHIYLRGAVPPGGLASLLTVVVYTYERSKTLACTCIQKLTPPTPTCWKWSVAQSETRALLSQIHAREALVVWLWSGLARCL